MLFLILLLGRFPGVSVFNNDTIIQIIFKQLGLFIEKTRIFAVPKGELQ